MFTLGVLGGTIGIVMLAILVACLLMIPILALWFSWRAFRLLRKPWEWEEDKRWSRDIQDRQRERQRAEIRRLYMADPRLCDFSVDKRLLYFTPPKGVLFPMMAPRKKSGETKGSQDCKTENP